MKSKKPLLLLLLVAIGVGGWLWYHRQSQAGDRTLYGNVDIREVNLGFRVAGKVSEVLKDEGDAVQAGDVLARLDQGPIQRQVGQAQAQVDALAAKLDELRHGNRPEEIAQARALLAQQQATLINNQRILDRQKNLFATKVTTRQALDDAQAALDVSSAQVNSARENLNLLEAGARVEDLAQAAANLENARQTLAAAQLQLADTTLAAPSEGTIITRALEPGAIVQTGATVLTLSLDHPVWVRAYIDEPQLGRIHPGLTVQVFTDSRPGQPYTGKIGYISPRAEFTPKAVETTELRTSLVYRLRIVVDAPDATLRQGMPVTVQLEP